jgi:hypothetical protein
MIAIIALLLFDMICTIGPLFVISGKKQISPVRVIKINFLNDKEHAGL